MFEIHPMFAVFPILVFAAIAVREFSLPKRYRPLGVGHTSYIVPKPRLYSRQPVLAIGVTAAFIILFVMTKNGADYEGYQEIYQIVGYQLSLDGIHGEKLYLALVKLAILNGLSYDAFRVVFLSACLIVLTYSMYRLSPSFGLSFLLLVLGYIAYLISAYRQFAVMAATFFCFHLYINRRMTYAPIAVLGAFCFVHISAVLPLGYFVLLALSKSMHIVKRVLTSVFYAVKHYSTPILVTCVAVRVVVYIALTRLGLFVYIQPLLRAYQGTELLSFGILSRLVTGLMVAELFKSMHSNRLINSLFGFYFFGIALYLCLPFEFLLGRLCNNARILDVVLIPVMALNGAPLARIERYSLMTPFGKTNIVLNSQKYLQTVVLACTLLVYFVVYFNQLLNQGGYYPYEHMLFG